jgi:hypothetical protein
MDGTLLRRVLWMTRANTKASSTKQIDELSNVSRSSRLKRTEGVGQPANGLLPSRKTVQPRIDDDLHQARTTEE